MAIKTIHNPLLEEGFQKLNDVSNSSFVQEITLSDATQNTITGSKGITDDSVQSFISRVTAIKTSTGDVWCHEFRGAIKRISTVTSLVDTVVDVYIAEDTATAAYAVAFVANAGTDELDIKVTSGDANEIKWKSETVFSEITF